MGSNQKTSDRGLTGKIIHLIGPVREEKLDEQTMIRSNCDNTFEAEHQIKLVIGFSRQVSKKKEPIKWDKAKIKTIRIKL